jgi:hypothetical protein
LPADERSEVRQAAEYKQIEDHVVADELIKVENLRRLDVQPGDRYVILTDHEISADTSDQIRRIWSQFAGKDVPLLVLPPGFELAVFRPDDSVSKLRMVVSELLDNSWRHDGKASKEWVALEEVAREVLAETNKQEERL